MTASVPTSEPEVLIAGDSWHWTKELADYPPGSGWTLHYSIRGPSVLADADVTVAEDGTVYDVLVAAAKTAALAAGTYQFAAFVTNAGGEKYTVETGLISVEADLSSALAGAAQPYAERMLAMVEAVLTGRITADVEAYQIAGRAVTKIPLAELRKLRASCKEELRRVRGGTMPVYRMRFTRVQ